MLKAAYVQKRPQSSINIEVDESVFADLNKNKTRRLSEKRRFDKILSVEERLALSSIKISNQVKLPEYQLPNNSHSLIKNWKKALNDKVDVFLQKPPPTNREEMIIANILSTLDTSSFSLLEGVPKEYLTTRPDIIIICYERVEVGCGEVKPPKKSRDLIDIDRARIAEICKRQLHLRLQTSSSTKEHCTFGILVGGMECL
ncbi:hypothetical protein J3Q64DRAFT_1702855 [Phycomyces blakesleeanus]|uniref:Uncharacterized protein n=1 Tax=Phycomyces blakesleeanus TaxID=4837 RepID=A0ABR3AMU6_PHYBL